MTGIGINTTDILDITKKDTLTTPDNFITSIGWVYWFVAKLAWQKLSANLKNSLLDTLTLTLKMMTSTKLTT